MSEASLLCLQNDLLCCMKEGKELFRCDESKRWDNIRLQSHPVPTRWHVSLKSPGLPVWLQGARRGWRPGACVGLQVFCASLGLTQPAATPGAAREAAATRHPPSSGRCLAPCDGRTSVQRRPLLTADTLGHLHYPELGTVEYKPSHTETCVGALRGNYSCPQCSLCSFVSRQQQNLAKTFHGPYLAPRFLMYKSRIAGEKSFWVLRITLRIRDWLIF